MNETGYSPVDASYKPLWQQEEETKATPEGVAPASTQLDSSTPPIGDGINKSQAEKVEPLAETVSKSEKQEPAYKPLWQLEAEADQLKSSAVSSTTKPATSTLSETTPTPQVEEPDPNYKPLWQQEEEVLANQNKTTSQKFGEVIGQTKVADGTNKALHLGQELFKSRTPTEALRLVKRQINRGMGIISRKS